ncbi:hypothetical protein FOZ63_028012 [Perkinsus olseni]|uniref:Uncharacterized protein n=1 Tax=Perkinsus olseni TaxID=32597 RepID=A0A7J6NFC6_PEROL|nr:hypothetical protein FOZ60_011700 [Perkinsus olseni]KAF4687462.1 hypothetical protein FOZ63_028012 [Perkinsus olseni]KAF4754090.1 hypothetical protein FOZ62_011376 [Perkinsus olseni]
MSLLLNFFCLLVAIEYCTAGCMRGFNKHGGPRLDLEELDKEQPDGKLPDEEQPGEKPPDEEHPDEKSPDGGQLKIEFFLSPADPGDGAKKVPNGAPGGAAPPDVDDASVHK